MSNELLPPNSKDNRRGSINTVRRKFRLSHIRDQAEDEAPPTSSEDEGCEEDYKEADIENSFDDHKIQDNEQAASLPSPMPDLVTSSNPSSPINLEFNPAREICNRNCDSIKSDSSVGSLTQNGISLASEVRKSTENFEAFNSVINWENNDCFDSDSCSVAENPRQLVKKMVSFDESQTHPEMRDNSSRSRIFSSGGEDKMRHFRMSSGYGTGGSKESTENKSKDGGGSDSDDVFSEEVASEVVPRFSLIDNCRSKLVPDALPVPPEGTQAQEGLNCPALGNNSSVSTDIPPEEQIPSFQQLLLDSLTSNIDVGSFQEASISSPHQSTPNEGASSHSRLLDQPTWTENTNYFAEKSDISYPKDLLRKKNENTSRQTRRPSSHQDRTSKRQTISCSDLVIHGTKSQLTSSDSELSDIEFPGSRLRRRGKKQSKKQNINEIIDPVRAISLYSKENTHEAMQYLIRYDKPAEEIERLLHFSEPEDPLSPAWNELKRRSSSTWPVGGAVGTQNNKPVEIKGVRVLKWSPEDTSDLKNEDPDSFGPQYDLDNEVRGMEELIDKLRMAVNCQEKTCTKQECKQGKDLLQHLDYCLREKNAVFKSRSSQHMLKSIASHSAVCDEIKCKVPWCTFFHDFDFGLEEQVARLLKLIKDSKRRITAKPSETDLFYLSPADNRFTKVQLEDVHWKPVAPLGQFSSKVFLVRGTDFGCNAHYVIRKEKADMRKLNLLTKKMLQLEHNNIVRHNWVLQQGGQIFLCTNFESAPTLEEYQGGKGLPFHQVLTLTCQLANVGKFLLVQKIAFLDWRASNVIFYENENVVKLRNFSQAVYFNEHLDEESVEDLMYCLPPEIVPPEMYAEGEDYYDLSKADCWGLGCLVYEMTLGHIVHKELSHLRPEVARRKVKENGKPDFKIIEKFEIKKFLLKCFQERILRPSMHEFCKVLNETQ